MPLPAGEFDTPLRAQDARRVIDVVFYVLEYLSQMHAL